MPEPKATNPDGGSKNPPSDPASKGNQPGESARIQQLEADLAKERQEKENQKVRAEKAESQLRSVKESSTQANTNSPTGLDPNVQALSESVTKLNDSVETIKKKLEQSNSDREFDAAFERSLSRFSIPSDKVDVVKGMVRDSKQRDPDSSIDDILGAMNYSMADGDAASVPNATDPSDFNKSVANPNEPLTAESAKKLSSKDLSARMLTARNEQESTILAEESSRRMMEPQQSAQPVPSGQPPAPTGTPPVPTGTPPAPAGTPPAPTGTPPVST